MYGFIFVYLVTFTTAVANWAEEAANTNDVSDAQTQSKQLIDLIC